MEVRRILGLSECKYSGVAREIDILRNFPKRAAKRSQRRAVTDDDRRISKQFGFEYFDGGRQHGYGGYAYHPRFWSQVAVDIRDTYQLQPSAKILDVGCAKGFLLYDLAELLPDATLVGVDISEYALGNSKKHERVSFARANAHSLPFATNSFDLVLSINTIHNLPRNLCMEALSEIQRVSSAHAYVMVDGWRTAIEKKALEDWVLTAETVLSANGWIDLFKQAAYGGDFGFWSVPHE